MSAATAACLPYRGNFGDRRPPALDELALPPFAMPSHDGRRPLKAWRYVGVFGPELMLCMARVRIGPARQCFWAVWDRGAGQLHERTRLGGRVVQLSHGRAVIRDRAVQADLELTETAGIEAVCGSGDSYAWTRKQGGIRARGTLIWEACADRCTRARSSMTPPPITSATRAGAGAPA